MEDSLRLRLKEQLPEQFKIESATDYEYNGHAKVRGLIGQYAVVMEYSYIENPDEIWLSTEDLNGQYKEGPCPIDKLKAVLLTLC